MWRLRSMASRFRGLFMVSDRDRQLSGEIEEHLHLLAERFVQQGMAREEAEYAARRQFGGVAQLQENHREARGVPLVENFLRDLSLSIRMLRKRPGFSLIAIAVLALGLGANTAIFSVVNRILLRPLPFAHPEQLVGLFERDVIDNGDPYNAVGPANFLDWRKQATTLQQIAAISYTRFNLSDDLKSAVPERIDACACSANFFDTLGVMPALGRAFRPEEDRPGAPRVAVISYGLWKRRFNGSPVVLFRAIKLDSQLYTVVGVMPPDFSYPARSIQAWVPLQTYLSPVVLEAHDNHVLTVIGRLRPGVPVAQANAEIDAIIRRYKTQHPQEVMGKGGNVVPLAEYAVKDIRKLLLLLFGAVNCVLLIACVNVANLLLSRTVGRKREVAIRAALGASRGRNVRQLVMESVVLSALGGVAGLLLAAGLTRSLAVWTPEVAWIPQAAKISLDPMVLLFSLSVALATGVISGLIPALQATASLDVVQGLKEGGRSNTAGRSQNRFREMLVVAEVALSLVLLLAAGLLMRSFSHLLSTDLGLRISNTLTMKVSLPDLKYHERTQISAFLNELAQRLHAIPGVRDAGLSSCPAVTQAGFCPDSVFQIEHHASPPGHLMDAEYRGVDPGFFRAAGIPILRGRTFTKADGIGLDDKHPHPGAVVINQALAKQFFPALDPLGEYITLYWFVGNNTERTVLRYRVVGITGNVLARPQSPPQPNFYLPLLDGDSNEISIILHTAIDPGPVAADARSIIHGMDPDLPIFGLQSLGESVGETMHDQKFVTTLLAVFAGIAILLAVAGLYGVVSWGVSQRVNEIAIRMALGATPGGVRRMILFKGLRPTFLGIAIGTPAAVAASGLLRGFLFEVGAVDPLTFTIVPLMLLAVAGLACSVPAIRATRIDPTIGLRAE